MDKDTIIIKCDKGEISLYLGQITEINVTKKTLKYRERKAFERKAKKYKLEKVKDIKKILIRVKIYFEKIAE